MRMTPAARHYQETLAAQALQASANGERTVENATEYERMLIQLAEHRRQLKAIQSQEGKATLKADLVKHYSAWVAGVIAGGTGAQDEVLTTIMIWLIDAGDIAAAVPLIEYALKFDLKLPDNYARSLAVVVVEESALVELRVANSKFIDIASLNKINELTQSLDMPDQVRARLIKAIGLGTKEEAEKQLEVKDKKSLFELSLKHLNRALELDSKAGVKKEIQNLERTIKNLGDIKP